jgi:hypothetical protein
MRSLPPSLNVRSLPPSFKSLPPSPQWRTEHIRSLTPSRNVRSHPSSLNVRSLPPSFKSLPPSLNGGQRCSMCSRGSMPLFEISRQAEQKEEEKKEEEDKGGGGGGGAEKILSNSEERGRRFFFWARPRDAGFSPLSLHAAVREPLGGGREGRGQVKCQVPRQ